MADTKDKQIRKLSHNAVKQSWMITFVDEIQEV